MPEAPQTMRQNWIPFFTFFLRRSLGPGMLLEDMVAGVDVGAGEWDGDGVGEASLAAIAMISDNVQWSL